MERLQFPTPFEPRVTLKCTRKRVAGPLRFWRLIRKECNTLPWRFKVLNGIKHVQGNICATSRFVRIELLRIFFYRFLPVKPSRNRNDFGVQSVNDSTIATTTTKSVVTGSSGLCRCERVSVLFPRRLSYVRFPPVHVPTSSTEPI